MFCFSVKWWISVEYLNRESDEPSKLVWQVCSMNGVFDILCWSMIILLFKLQSCALMFNYNVYNKCKS
jgi:hypothetical protein